MNIPKLVYKSLDVGTPYFSTITNYVIEMTLGHVITSPLGQVVTLFQWSRYSPGNLATFFTQLGTNCNIIFFTTVSFYEVRTPY